MAKKKPVKKKEKICEVFEVEKKGKKETIEACGEEEVPDATKNQIKQENQILKNIFVGIVIFILVFVAIFLFADSTKHFEYRGMKFNIIKQGDVILYNSVFPIYSAGTKEHIADYNVYLRNDPRKLEDIPFDGEIVLTNLLVVNSTEKFNCDGDGIIAMANFNQVLKTFGVNVVKDPNATCDSQERYSFVQIQSSNTTSINRTGPSCYEFNVNNCEVLKVTEKFMLETLIKINKNIK